jgi:tRNA nucleotidyltransferase (CCA-adding enzyme)
LKLSLPPALRDLALRLREAGGRPYLVGGAVRDALLGLPVKDFDVEVFGLPVEALKAVLAEGHSVNAVGESFTVFKVAGLQGVEGAVDVSIPRRDSKVGPGHRGIAVAGDPELPVVEAARRRDFTINALLFDPQTGQVLDPHGGLPDLEGRVLRAVDPGSFGDDPLRALRAVQFVARFELSVEPGTALLCSSMPLRELPAERIFGEIEKLLLRARRPSLGLRALCAWGMLPAIAPELLPLASTAQDPEWHPEGDVWTHTLLAVDQAAGLLDGLDHARALTVMLAALCHDLGKPSTTRLEEGRIRSRGHEEAGVAPTLALLERWNVHTLGGYDVRAQVVALVADHLKPGQLYDDRDRVSDGAIRRLARRCEPDLLDRVARADCLGRTGQHPPLAMDWFRARVAQLHVEREPPQPLLLGRHVLQLGVSPGREVGRVVKAVYERQLDGQVTTLESAIAAARELLSR